MDGNCEGKLAGGYRYRGITLSGFVDCGIDLSILYFRKSKNPLNVA